MLDDRALVFVTQTLDVDHPVLGFVPGQVRALRGRVGELVVVANQVGRLPPDLGVEVVSLGKERGAGRLSRTLRYQAALSRLLSRRRPTALFAHMCPIYLVLATPIARSTRTRTLLWFTHSRDSSQLRLADRLSSAVLTTAPGSYPRPSPKLIVTGHSIDVEHYPLAPVDTSGPLRLLCLGRFSPSKRLDVALHAVAALPDLGRRVELRLVGPTTTAEERAHRAALVELCGRLGISDRVRFEGPVPHVSVPDVLAHSSALLNPTVLGSADKVVLEAMASGVPAVTAAGAFSDLLADLPVNLTFPPGDAEALAERIADLASQPPAALRALGMELRRRAERHHGLGGWADQVIAAAFP